MLWFGAPGTRISFWISLTAVQAIAWFLIWSTCRALPMLWMERVVKSGVEARLQAWESRIWGWEARLKLRRKLLIVNPFYWLAAREPQKPWYVWGFVVLVLAVWAAGFIDNSDVMFDFWPMVPTVVMVHGMLKLWIVSEVSHRLVSDQRSGSLELLLSSPLQPRRIIEGQMLALRRFFLAPLIFLFAIELGGLSTHFSWKAILVVQGLFVADFVTLHWLAMWLSLISRSVNQVFLVCVGLVMVLPWLLCAMATFIWLTVFEARFGALSFGTKVCIWAGISLAVDLLVGWRWARSNLLHHFRDAVLQRFAKAEAPNLKN